MKTVMLMLWLVSFGLIVSAEVMNVEEAGSKAQKNVFYVYKDGGSILNHFSPGGWMGDTSDLRMGQKEVVEGGNTCIKITYTAERRQGNGWAGIYWQHPASNWGDKRGGFDLSGFKKATFKAKGEKGGEYVEKFFVGGIQGQHEDGDSGNSESGGIELTKDWKSYEIDLGDQDMSHIIGGFGLAFSADSNEKGCTIYLDEVRYEK